MSHATRDLLRVENLHVGFGPRRSVTPVVNGISFSVQAGRCLAVRGCQP